MIEMRSKQSAFTIVELLVVIVVIGILAAITIVSYTGITSRVAKATLQSDLKNASTQLGMDNVTNGTYPTSEAESNGGKGLPKSSGTTYQYSETGTGYCISATSTAAGSSSSYRITPTSGAVEIGACPLVWKQIDAGSRHVCAVASNDLAYCWGGNWNGFLGNNSTTQSNIPVAVYTAGAFNGKTIKNIVAGYYFNCAIASDNLAYCWGYNEFGQLGNNSVDESHVPVAVTIAGTPLSGKTIKSISSGAEHTCVIASDDLAYCWGLNSNGQLGNNSIVESHVSVAVTIAGTPLSGKTIKSITTGGYHTCVIASDDLAYCWGRNGDGQFGNNSNTQSLVPVAVSMTGALSGKTIKSISASESHTCVIASNDLAYCWGANWNGQLGDNSNTDRWIPVAVYTSGVLSGKTIKSIAAGYLHTCAIASDNLAYCWGYNAGGQIGDNSSSDRWFPVAVNTTAVLSGKTIKSISASNYRHSCAIASDNQAYCWGLNDFGQLGNNSVNPSLVPVATISL